MKMWTDGRSNGYRIAFGIAVAVGVVLGWVIFK